MKTAEEILRKHHTGVYINENIVINAMEEYASQFRTQPVTDEEIKSFHWFENHGDDEGNNCYTIGYGTSSDDVNFLIVSVDDTEANATETCNRLNWILNQSRLSQSVTGYSDQWISVKDKLPEDHQQVFICFESGDISVGYYCDDVDANWWSDYFKDLPEAKITHWMPLPTRPKTK